jgi:hypothetical protein
MNFGRRERRERTRERENEREREKERIRRDWWKYLKFVTHRNVSPKPAF